MSRVIRLALRLPWRVVMLTLLASLALTATAQAEAPGMDSSTSHVTSVPGTLPETPTDYAVSAFKALRAADQDPKVIARKAELRESDDQLTAAVSAEAVRVWEVSYLDRDGKVNLVVVDGTTGEVKESWTGSAVDWPMARGHEGQFGHLLNAPWVWGPLAAIFLLGLVDFRRWRKWVHLDLLVLLSFGISQAYFNAAEIGVSVPLYYPPLLYLLARMLWIGFRGTGRDGGAGEGLRPSMPRWLMTALLVALIGLRLAGNIADSGVIDVGYAGVIGADKITDAKPIYGAGSFPEDNPTGDTYGPANYFAYVPFEAVLPWSGSWDDLPAAHAAAIFFDLATIAGLFMLGRSLVPRRREGRRADAEDPRSSFGPPTPQGSQPVGTPEYQGAKRSRTDRLLALLHLRGRFPGPRANAVGLTLAFAWVAYPYSTFALQSNSNDSLIAALLVWSLVFFASPVARGGLLAVASLTKFAPLALFPLYAAGGEGIRLRVPEARRTVLRPLALFTAAFVAGSVLLLAHPAVDPGLADFYDRTIKSQVDRISPFSIWGQVDLGWLHTATKAFAVGLAVLVAFVPRQRSLPQIAALSAAVLIAIELTLEHWFYLYVPWFLGAMLAAIVGASAITATRPGGRISRSPS